MALTMGERAGRLIASLLASHGVVAFGSEPHLPAMLSGTSGLSSPEALLA
jgi:hypothetical protein